MTCSLLSLIAPHGTSKQTIHERMPIKKLQPSLGAKLGIALATIGNSQSTACGSTLTEPADGLFWVGAKHRPIPSSTRRFT
jgi:hypothetical protein